MKTVHYYVLFNWQKQFLNEMFFMLLLHFKLFSNSKFGLLHPAIIDIFLLKIHSSEIVSVKQFLEICFLYFLGTFKQDSVNKAYKLGNVNLLIFFEISKPQ